ncbi:uncharacterized protein M421DRAFT_90916 [Didymella exigua CBS 183.55]|uniref:Uncharacterized protein n=1 Tax=Didymella exigua CBS 183.55 TaxID=1150837 RepID=A0A6A5RRG1_9PLEO|nr:uncharacterized protein M421DRAFT_90916 [Didymella exigua CBS 183.55]KAF1930362.1 hypothetical protein M421DRAFT_90916 [Didymella exigua CBS 183.55]
MATHAPPPPYEMLYGCPTPPPTASSAYGPPRFLPQANHTPPLYKRKPLHTPPAEFTPIGKNQFTFTRAQSIECSSRPSSVSGHAHAGTAAQETEYEDSSKEESEEEDDRPRRPMDEASFELEEVDSDETDDESVEVVQPDHCEDAKSDKSGAALEATGIMDSMGALHVSEESHDTDEEAEALARIYRRRKKSMSQRWVDRKRDHDRSVAGDSSYSDNDPQDDNNIEARRLRRKLSGYGPWDRRASLIFEDQGFPNTNNIIEEEEPEEGVVKHTKGPPSIPSDDAFTLDELPFWGGAYETMEVMTGAE